MKELSIFIDESGDFGKYDPKAPFYIISLVLHDQAVDLSEPMGYLRRGLSETSLKRNFVHMGPLIRRESEYKQLTVLERTKILRKMVNFVTKATFLQKSFVVEKKHIDNEFELISKFTRQLSPFIEQNYDFFLRFDRIKIYYDNGQEGVMKIIATVFFTHFENAEFKKALQKDYYLLQTADLVCTAKLTELKMANKTLSHSERRILGSDRDINKNLLKPLRRKEFKN